MTLPVSILLIPLLLGGFAFIGMSAINIYHVLRFGAFDLRNNLVVLMFVVYTLLILAFSIWYLLGVDWSQSFTIQLPAAGLETGVGL